MNDDQMRREIREAMDSCLSGVRPDPFLKQHVLEGKNTAGRGRRPRTLAAAAALLTVAAALVLLVGSMPPVWPDARKTAPVTEGAAAAPDHYGWKEYLAEEARPPLLPAVREILDGTQERIYTLSPPAGTTQECPFAVRFAVQEQYADPYTAIISVHVTLREGDEGFLCPEQADRPIDPAAAEHLGVSEELSWQEASEQLNLPMYRIWVGMDAAEALFRDRGALPACAADYRCHEDGSLTFLVTGYLYGLPDSDRYSVPLHLAVQPYRSGIPIYDSVSGYLFTEIALPFRIEAVSGTRGYGFPDNQTVRLKAGMLRGDNGTEQARNAEADLTCHLVRVQADLTPAGLYVRAEFAAEEGNGAVPLPGPTAAAYSTEGLPLPAGLNDQMPIHDAASSTVTFACMINTDTFPESMVFELHSQGTDGDETILSVPLTLSGTPAARRFDTGKAPLPSGNGRPMPSW